MIPVPLQFFRTHFEPTWADVAFGLSLGLIAPDEVVDFAALRIDATSGRELVELAGLGRDEINQTTNLVRKLAACEEPREAEAAKQRWLYVVLDFLHKHRRADSDLPAQVEDIYVEFDYPDELSRFIPYMPRHENPFKGTSDPIFSDPKKYAKAVEDFAVDGFRSLSRTPPSS